MGANIQTKDQTAAIMLLQKNTEQKQEALKYLKGKPAEVKNPPAINEEVFKTHYYNLKKDAERYRFLRDESNWKGEWEDCEHLSWAALGENTEGFFDNIVDERMKLTGK